MPPKPRSSTTTRRPARKPARKPARAKSKPAARSATTTEAATLLAGIRSGRAADLARAISRVESGDPVAFQLLDACAPCASPTGATPAQRIGITGPPGTGKSTLVASLVAHLRAAAPAIRIGIVAVDPSSPLTGGALLGDRFRMSAVASDPGVFIRSMASRGALGGLSEATEGACDLLEYAGYARLIIETVGVGQNEVEIAAAAGTVVLVLNPENGDSLQALKAGLMEIADIVVVNKADHPRTARFISDVQSGLELNTRAHDSGWRVPVIATVATDGNGTPEVAAAIASHAGFLATSGQGELRRATRIRSRIRRLWLASLNRMAGKEGLLTAKLDAAVKTVASGKLSAVAAAAKLAEATRLARK